MVPSENTDETSCIPTAVIEDYIFGFGSLINTKSRCSSDPDAVDAVPVRISADVGYARSWNFQHPAAQITALGLEKTTLDSGQPINGVVTPVLTSAGMAAVDEREIGYTRVAITLEQLQPLGCSKFPDDARIWMYVPNGRDEAGTPGVGLNPASFTHPILQTYVDVCVLGCLEYSEEFAIEFITSTRGWGCPWLNDREVPRRPWIHQPKCFTIDRLLERVIPTEFKNRMLPEEFAHAMSQWQKAVKKKQLTLAGTSAFECNDVDIHLDMSYLHQMSYPGHPHWSRSLSSPSLQ